MVAFVLHFASINLNNEPNNTGRAAGTCLLMVARPFRFPCMFEAPSNACPLHMDSERARVRMSVITLYKVSALVSGRQ